MQYLEKDKTRGAVPRVMQKEAGQVQGGLRYLGQLFKQLQVGSSFSAAAGLDCLVERHLCWHVYLSWCTVLATRPLSDICFLDSKQTSICCS